jgi:signal transduction histidine kinase
MNVQEVSGRILYTIVFISWLSYNVVSLNILIITSDVFNQPVYQTLWLSCIQTVIFNSILLYNIFRPKVHTRIPLVACSFIIVLIVNSWNVLELYNFITIKDRQALNATYPTFYTWDTGNIITNYMICLICLIYNITNTCIGWCEDTETGSYTDQEENLGERLVEDTCIEQAQYVK